MIGNVKAVLASTQKKDRPTATNIGRLVRFFKMVDKSIVQYDKVYCHIPCHLTTTKLRSTSATMFIACQMLKV